MRTAKGVGLLASILTLIYGIYIVGRFITLMAGFWRPTSSVLNPWVLAALDMIVYIFLGAQILRDRREFFVMVIFWTIFGTVLATFGFSYRDDVLNLLSLLIVFFTTYYLGTAAKADLNLLKSVGLFAGILALVQGLFVAFATVFAYIFFFEGWLIPVQLLSQTLSTPPVTVAVITVVVYMVSGVGMISKRKEFFVLAILWTLLESALAVAYSSFVRSHFNLISILILTFATYYYFSKT